MVGVSSGESAGKNVKWFIMGYKKIVNIGSLIMVLLAYSVFFQQLIVNK